MFFGYQFRGIEQSHSEQISSLYYRSILIVPEKTKTKTKNKKTFFVFREEREVKIGIGNQTTSH